MEDNYQHQYNLVLLHVQLNIQLSLDNLLYNLNVMDEFVDDLETRRKSIYFIKILFF